MDSLDEPSAGASPLISGRADNDDFLELASGQLGEGHGPRPAPIPEPDSRPSSVTSL